MYKLYKYKHYPYRENYCARRLCRFETSVSLTHTHKYTILSSERSTVYGVNCNLKFYFVNCSLYFVEHDVSFMKNEWLIK